MKELFENKTLLSLFLAISFGLIILLLVALTVSGAFTIPQNNDGGWIYHYQALIAGILAFIGTAFAAWQVRKLNQENRKREEAHARALLHDAFVDLSEFAQAAFRYMFNEGKNVEVHRPRSASESLARVIKYVDDLGTRDQLSKLLEEYQVTYSRCNEDFLSRLVARNAADFLDDIVKFYSRVSEGFDFARGATSSFIFDETAKGMKGKMKTQFEYLSGITDIDYIGPEYGTSADTRGDDLISYGIVQEPQLEYASSGDLTSKQVATIMAYKRTLKKYK